MAEPRPFPFDSEQRSVGAAGGRRRLAWPWIALSLALHGAVVLFALVGAARGGHTELLGTLEVTVVGAPSAGDPDSRDAEGEADTKPAPAAVTRPEAPPKAPSEAAPLPQPARAPRHETLAPSAPQRTEAEAPKAPDSVTPDPIALPRKAAAAVPSPAAPHLEEAKRAPERPPAPRKAAQPASLPRAGVRQAPKGQTASLGAPTGGERLGRSDHDDTAGLLSVNLNPRFRRPPAPPIYPRASIERDEEGIVLVRALVDPAGAPQRVIVHKGSGFPLLDEAALRAVRGWRFEPMVRGGRAVAAWVQVPVRFRLN